MLQVGLLVEMNVWTTVELVVRALRAWSPRGQRSNLVWQILMRPLLGDPGELPDVERLPAGAGVDSRFP